MAPDGVLGLIRKGFDMSMAVDYGQRIPNNVSLHSDRRLQRALELWQPRFLDWWRELGPDGFQESDVYLRTAVSIEPGGWAHFAHVKMPEYRWGIFLTSPEKDRQIGFGEEKGLPVWNQVPGQHRADLRRLIVTQGDTEPASVEQQRLLGRMAPSLYDLRNLFQVNVEEGRHLWAMVYLLHAYFGRDGRDEADLILERHAGDPDRPRILGAFNELTPDWLAFYMFTYFTDRDGKYQLASLAESAFDPLARTCQFMLTEEAHHMFVGESGVKRIVQRSAELMREQDSNEIRAFGGIDLATIQRYINFHYSVSLDLFGGERSSNAAAYYSAGLKGRYNEAKINDDHVLTKTLQPVPEWRDGKPGTTDVPEINALNERLRQDFVRDCERGVARWNSVLEAHDISARLYLPHIAFNRRMGTFAGRYVTPEGISIDETDWTEQSRTWLPTDEDKAFVASIMEPVTERGKIANWIAPPARGIDGRAFDYEYVRLV